MESGFDWDGTDFLEYAFSEPPKQRTRKVTITEINDNENEDWTFVDNPEEENELLKSDEIFDLLDDLVHDWKIKLEIIIGDGLKKMKKSGKEKKLMTKYLPGENFNNKLLQEAKIDILKDWKTDFLRILKSTQRKLEKLASEKFRETEELFKTKINAPKKSEIINSSKKTIINIDYSSNFNNLKSLMRELESLNAFAPIYESKKEFSLMKRGPFEIVPTYKTSENWFYHKYETERRRKLREIAIPLPDYSLKVEKRTKKAEKRTKKVSRRCTNVVEAQKRMLERKRTYQIREFRSKNGETHVILVKKRIKMNKENENVEDIFRDWAKRNLDQIKKKSRRTTPRKMSHKGLRKELIKRALEEEEKRPNGRPLLYSEILKKNLKNSADPIEDIFEAWRDYLKELDQVLNSNSSSEGEEELTCGQPTVKCLKTTFPGGKIVKKLNVKKQQKVKTRKRPRKYIQESIFGSWRHIFDDQPIKLKSRKYTQEAIFENGSFIFEEEQQQLQKQRKYTKEKIFESWKHIFNEKTQSLPTPQIIENDGYKVEKIFGSWRRNFFERKSKKPAAAVGVLYPEDFFSDWLHNLEDKQLKSPISPKRQHSKKNHKIDAKESHKKRQQNHRKVKMD